MPQWVNTPRSKGSLRRSETTISMAPVSHGPGVEHGGPAHADARARGHGSRDHELALGDARHLARDTKGLARKIDLRHVHLAAQRQRDAGRGPRGENAGDAGRIADRSR